MELPVVQTDSTQGMPGSPRDGDLQELTAIVVKRLHYLQRIAMRQLGNCQDAEDAVQDALFSAYRNLSQFRGQAQMSTWLTTIVINCARMRARERSRQPRLSLDSYNLDNDQFVYFDGLSDSAPDPEDMFRVTELQDKMKRMSSRLSPLLRETFHLRAVDELSVRETATRLGIQETAVKVRVSRARAILKRMLQMEG